MSISQEQVSEQTPPSAKKPGLRELFRLSVVQAMETMGGLKPQKGTRSKINAALLGGVWLEQTQYAAGHSDPRTTQRYRKRKLNLDHNAVDTLHFTKRH